MSGPLPISLSEILAFAEIHGIEKEEIEEFAWTIRILDAEWLSDFYKRQKSSSSNKGHKK